MKREAVLYEYSSCSAAKITFSSFRQLDIGGGISVGAVGVLQFEVLEYRLNEYNTWI